MNSDYATLLASTGFGALAQGTLSLPSGAKAQQQLGAGGGATGIPMTDPRTNISNAGATLNALKDADKKYLITVPGLEDDVIGVGGIPGSGGDLPSPSDFDRAGSGSLHENGLRAMMGESGTPAGANAASEPAGSSSTDDFLSTDGTSYFFGKYEVFMGSDGSICVKKDDWLSKYSAAIYGDFWHVYEYARKNVAGELERIIDVHHIYEGETIYHLPTAYADWEGEIVEAQPPKPSVTDKEKKEIIINTVDTLYGLTPGWKSYLKIILDIAPGVLDTAIGVLEIIGFVGGTMAGVSSAILAPVGVILSSMMSITNAYTLSQRGFSMRAFAYSLTAWAFGDPFPPEPSQEHLKSILQGKPQGEIEEIRRVHIDAWEKVCSSTNNAIEKEVLKSELPYAEANELRRAAFRAFVHDKPEGERRKAFTIEVLKGFEMEFATGIERQSWVAGYNIEYPE
jgi:hypothetical protein